jgi:cyanate permease
MPRLACTLIGSALLLVAGLVAMLLGDAFAPARLPALFAFWIAAGAGLLLMVGLMLLDHRGEAARRVRIR